MEGSQAGGTPPVVRWLALAGRMERHGQYNTAKLLRAAADAVLRRGAWELQLPTDAEPLLGELEQAAAQLAADPLTAPLAGGVEQGREKLAAEELPRFAEIPDPYVCRRCGHATADAPDTPCPVCRSWPATYQRLRAVYWLRELDPFESLQRLQETPQRVAALLDGVSAAGITRQPAAGGWSVGQVLVHLHDTEGLLRHRMELILEQDDPLLSAEQVWAHTASQGSPQAVFNAYETSRRATLERLHGIPLTDWWRTGVHEEFGRLTLWEQVSYFAVHETTHLRQIQMLREEVS